MSNPFPAQCLYVTGVTAAGKTQIGIELAKLVGGEIIAMDSMTVYRGLDIGTAKPTAEERAAAAHHLLDVVEPAAEFSQAEYAAAARAAVDDVLARGKLPIFVGGTPLYLKTLLRGMFEGPPANWEFRRRMEEQAAREEPGWLQKKLAEVDPQAAAKLHANDIRRLVRALEVYALTGVPISEHQKHFEHVRSEAKGRVFVIDWPRERMMIRINERVDAMIAAGLVDEVRRLQATGTGLGRTARQALGYREVLEHLADRITHKQMVEAAKTHTRQFAKRQLTWFRSLGECSWISIFGDFDPRKTAQKIYAGLWARLK
jgi:tRNA dimethylallyltransferase